ncbi:MAG: M23 family metallopeptidase [Ruminococcaceae bacterium]|nr:M23 family metallopeptidase [Oscillospiraceae bacterium]
MNFKKILITILCLAILFIPTYIAVANYKDAQKSPITDTSINGLKLVDPNGAVYEMTDSENIAYFVELTESGKEMSELPDEMKNVSPSTVIYKCINGNDYEFKYYFTADPDECFVTDYKNRVFRLSSEDALKFLDSEKAGYLYSGSEYPTLSVSGNALLPKAMQWAYFTAGNKKIDVDCELAKDSLTIETTKGFDLSYSIKPDVITVQIEQDGNTLFNGLYENIGTFNFMENSDLNVKVTAQWNEDDLNRRSGGTAEYNFALSVLPAPVFTLGTDSVIHGEFVAVTCENVSDPSKITFNSVPAIDFTPKFHDVGGYAVALIPINVELKYSDSYEFSFTYGDTTRKLTLNVKDKTYKTTNLQTQVSTLNTYRTSTAINEYNEVLGNYLKTSSSSKYFEGYFGEGSSKPLQILMGFGLHVKLATGNEYRNDGVDFGFASTNDTAAAVNAGVVVYTGKLTYSGNTVIVDHGIGLMSVYCNLDSFAVSVGQELKRGDVIGNIGNTGCTDITRLHVGVYVYGVPVKPYRLWKDGTDMEVKIYVPEKNNVTTGEDNTPITDEH